ncbi:MAG: TetR/AcrR family transcriptional regulator [Thermoleophilaceae bacterium]
MPEPAPTRRAGRAAEAARNDDLILNAAREVFLADPRAPISAVAKRAGVGISALYSRYESKEELLRKLSRDGLEIFLEAIDAAVRDERDPWTVFADFMRRLVDADIAALTLTLAGRFAPTEDMFALAARTDTELSERLWPRVREALRPGVEVGDVSLVAEIVGTVKVADPGRTRRLRHRYLEALLDGLSAERAEPLPGPAPTREEINERWEAES